MIKWPDDSAYRGTASVHNAVPYRKKQENRKANPKYARYYHEADIIAGDSTM